jgi:formylmethanofuran dehydrogenase subunit E
MTSELRQEHIDILRESVEQFIAQPNRDLMAEINYRTARLLFDKKPIVANPDKLSPKEIESLKAKIHSSSGPVLRFIPNQIACNPTVCEQCREEVRAERAECADGKTYCIPCFVETNVLRDSSYDPE